MQKKRCGWVNLDNPLYVAYHDQEWGRPVYEDGRLFEFLLLEGAQAGLSWETVLKKRERYREVFAGFVPQKVARFSAAKVEKLLLDPGIIRNRRKVESAITNARAFLKVQREFGTFSDYLWGHVDHRPLVNHFANWREVPAKTELSDQLSRDLKKRGFSFVGSTIIYAYLQAVGVVDDHSADCFMRRSKAKRSRSPGAK